MTIPTTLILALPEAILYTKHTNVRSFRRWCAKWGCKSQSKGRYSVYALDAALKREANLEATP